jgi:signal transduction histidine kinase
MIRLSFLIASFGAVSFIASVILTAYIINSQKRTMQKLHNMLDSAIDNNFSEDTYDESSLSSLECKLSRFLAISKTSQKSNTEERNRIKSLVSDISHQTKTPISNIILYVQLLQEQNLNEQSKELVKEIYAQSEKLRFLIEALIKSSRLETGIIHVNPKDSSVLDLIGKCKNVIEKKAMDKGIKINISCDEEMTAFFDSKWTEEAIVNILDNAVKYTEQGGNIYISSEPYEIFTRVDISDTGIGINEEEINRIFQRFYRSREVSALEGVGIGLYLAREIISSQGGYIKVKSEYGRGSTFSVFLPNSIRN